MFTFLSSLGKHPSQDLPLNVIEKQKDTEQQNTEQQNIRMMFIDPEDLSKKIKPFLNKNINLKCDIPFVAKVKEVETFYIDMTFTSVPDFISVPGYKIISFSLKHYCVSPDPLIDDFITDFLIKDNFVKLTNTEILKTIVSDTTPLQIVGTLNVTRL